MHWNASERSLHLHRIVNNSRFLILPDVEVPNLASAVLGRVLRRLPGDWETRFGEAPWVVETFVDPSRYKGTSYRAAGFVCLGQTRWFEKTRTRGYYSWHGQPKDVYAFVLFYFAAIRSNTPVLLAPPRWAVPEAKVSRGKKPTNPRLTELPQKVSELAKTALPRRS